jgi:hypothetical protein
MSTAQDQNLIPKKRKGLRKKLILSMLVVGVLPLAVGLVMAFFLGTKQIQEVSGNSFQGIAVETGRKVDLVISEEIAATWRITSDHSIVQALEERRDRLDELSEVAVQNLVVEEVQKWKEQDPGFSSNILKGPLAKILQQHYSGGFQDPGQPNHYVLTPHYG